MITVLEYVVYGITGMLYLWWLALACEFVAVDIVMRLLAWRRARRNFPRARVVHGDIGICGRCRSPFDPRLRRYGGCLCGWVRD